MTLFEVNQAAAIIRERAHPDANMIFGAVVDEEMGDNIRITVIATGFEANPTRRQLISSVVRTEPQARGKTAASPAEKPMPSQPKRENRTAEPVSVAAQPTNSGSSKPKSEQAEAKPSRENPPDAPPRFSPNNLDIPAFLRRR